MAKETEQPKGTAQFKVVSKSDNYRRTYTNETGARKDYGQFTKMIEKDDQGDVELWYRADLKEEWILIEELVMGDIEEDEEDDE